MSQTECKHAQHIWAHFNIQTMGECHGLHVELDVLLLGDVMNKFQANMYATL